MRTWKTLQHFYNLTIRSKIWLCMVSIMFALGIFTGLLSIGCFTAFFREDARENARQTLSITEKTFSQSYQELLSQIVRFTTNNVFYQIAGNHHTQRQRSYSSNMAQLQDPLAVLKSSVPWIDSIIVVGTDKELYTLYENLQKDFDFDIFLTSQTEHIKGITWFTAQISPLQKKNTVIPVVVPLHNLLSSPYIVIADTIQEASTVILLFLDAERVAKALSQAVPDNSGNFCYLINQSDKRINPLNDFPKNTTSTTFLTYTAPLPFSGLSLVYVVSKQPLFARLASMKLFIVLIILVGFILTTALSFALSNFVTQPFARLMAVIEKIASNSYDTPYEPSNNDETGKLAAAINSMHTTIQNQIRQIKQDERAKYHLELQLLAEQINPHFLYNTLESIHLEVANGNGKAANSMIENLGKVLRFSLNHGEDTITARDEIAQARSYLAIMNHRLSRTIRCSATIEPQLEAHRILKNILQPLAENSIKHGFIKEKCEGLVQSPCIEISVSRQNNCLVIEVADNGCGIDIEKAKTAAFDKTLSKHLGLQNIYRRLRIFYGKAEMEFQSIPFFRNSVIITIPYEGENGES